MLEVSKLYKVMKVTPYMVLLFSAAHLWAIETCAVYKYSSISPSPLSLSSIFLSRLSISPSLILTNLQVYILGLCRLCQLGWVC